MKAVKGSDVTLDCDVKAAPRPQVQWVDTNDVPIKRKSGHGSKWEFVEKNGLLLKSVHLGDTGLYYCNVSNKYGINRARRKLEVYGSSLAMWFG